MHTLGATHAYTQQCAGRGQQVAAWRVPCSAGGWRSSLAAESCHPSAPWVPSAPAVVRDMGMGALSCGAGDSAARSRCRRSRIWAHTFAPKKGSPPAAPCAAMTGKRSSAKQGALAAHRCEGARCRMHKSVSIPQVPMACGRLVTTTQAGNAVDSCLARPRGSKPRARRTPAHWLTCEGFYVTAWQRSDTRGPRELGHSSVCQPANHGPMQGS
jgi:hypothetical protein